MLGYCVWVKAVAVPAIKKNGRFQRSAEGFLHFLQMKIGGLSFPIPPRHLCPVAWIRQASSADED
jgi:hypothetical protein